MGKQMKERDKEHLIDLLIEAGGIEGAHHKQWAIDQALRVLMGKSYDHLGQEWDQGIAP